MKEKWHNNAIIWLQDGEDEGEADCGCRLINDEDGARFIMCRKHAAADNASTANRKGGPAVQKQFMINRDEFVHQKPTTFAAAFAELQEVAKNLRNRDLTYYFDMVVDGDIDHKESLTVARLDASSGIVFTDIAIQKLLLDSSCLNAPPYKPERLLVGRTVTIYKDPLKQTNVDGRAKLLKKHTGNRGHFDGHPLEEWRVKFVDDGFEADRVILNLNKVAA